MEEDQILSLLIELKEDVAALRADVSNISALKLEVDALNKKVNVAHGAVLAVGVIISFLLAIGKIVFKS
jgi:hypothetical protein